MELGERDGAFIFEKELNSLDTFVIEFTAHLDKLQIPYVIVSGYVAILFGRNRSSEDIDLLIGKIDYETFKRLWDELRETFECLNTEKSEDAYHEYLSTGHAIRFSYPGAYLPNMEIKFPKIEPETIALTQKRAVILNKHQLFISPLELQIAFKFYLGSEKDIEDALYLYNMFKRKLNMILLHEYNRKLHIEKLASRYLQ